MGHLKLQAVTKTFGNVEVIRATDLTIEEGEFVVFVGPSGCGKSTMLRMIAGLEEISSGTIAIDGRVVNDIAPVERGIAMVFQSYALYPHMTVFENIAFPLRVAKLAKGEVDQRVRRAAELLKLSDRLEYKPGELSGGQRQRVAIGRAIVREPSVFLFDEPLSNLDAALRSEMRVELSRLHASLGNTMIYVTHDQIEAMTMATKIVVLRAGRVEQVGSPLELFHKPANRFVAGFIGNPTMNFIAAEGISSSAEGATVRLSTGLELKLPVNGSIESGEALELGIRPDDLVLGGADAQIEMTPEVVERLGNQSVVHGITKTDQPLCAVIGGDRPISPGRPTRLGFDVAKAHLFRNDGTALERRVDLQSLVAD
ncbi:ABC transporter ATP-binding protein [Consotaella salsifontis]|uniref:Carbohydrate ABC transporter ATP-binding protein, CUT1 family n=1 Tax=Consotaella salsifontis TaxID=1365950 RepID=A0A1T4RAL2_9HYPH|nr:sn-glycerol-3-phosphate ABC transporter ATP-binding protein UgpC [Consotaella salsifontis]SKA12846.1 carbohydrate ABC transporter ATP-binding protein, CUT1 family [Consotaella salsifontis]